MVDLSVNFAGLELKNPLVVASSDNVRDIRQIRKAEQCGASAVITKALLPQGALGLHPKFRMFIDAKGMTRYGGCVARRLSYEEGIELVRAAKKETQIKVGVNIPFFKLEERESCAQVAERSAAAGADFVSVFVRRLDDVGHDGMQVVADAVKIFDHYKLPVQVIAASIRHPLHCVAAAQAGADIATVPFKVLEQMMQHPLTEAGNARFLADWRRVSGKT